MELGVGQAISWATFKEEFNDRFFPKMVQEEKAKEFMDLQGGMTVAASKFKQLSWFALYLIPEEKKAKKLERGLNPRIRTQIVTTHFFFFENIQMSHHSGMTMFH
jgi:hypothetical protein